MSKKYNGCIFLISARKTLLKTCLTLLHKNYNNKYNYPVLVFYHGTIYDDITYQNDIKKISNKISFHKIEAKIPSNITKNDLFYNLKNNEYVNKSFPKQRIGYLHANYFWNNFFKYLQLQDYDWMMRIDDDSWFKNPINFNLFEELDKRGYMCGSGYTWNYVHNRVLDTRVNFYQWIQYQHQ